MERFSWSAGEREVARAFRDCLARHHADGAVWTDVESSEGFSTRLWTSLHGPGGIVRHLVSGGGGGAGASAMLRSAVFEAAGYHCLSGPVLSGWSLAIALLEESADDLLLRELLEGRLIPAAAVGRLAEGDELLPAGQLAVHPDGSGWRINGVRDFVSFASASEHLLVPVTTGDGVDLFAVRRGAGVTVADMDRLDLTDRVQRVMFDDAPAARLRLRPDGFRRAMRRVAADAACLQTGGAAAMLDLMVAHAATRVQFGRVLGTFQAIKHQCAEVFLRVETARTAAYAAAWALEGDDALEAARATSMAKAYCSDAYLFAASEATQVLGGGGVLWRTPTNLHLRRAKALEVGFGSATWHRRRLAVSLLRTRSQA